jgi:hypothetical protein
MNHIEQRAIQLIQKYGLEGAIEHTENLVNVFSVGIEQTTDKADIQIHQYWKDVLQNLNNEAQSKN